MATPPTLGADNLKIAQELLATMAQISSQLTSQTQTYQAQAKLVEALCDAQDCFNKLDSNKIKEVTESLKEARDNTKDYGTETEKVLKHNEDMNESVKNLAEKVKKLSFPKEFINGFKAGLHLSNSLFGTIMRMGATSVGILANLGKALLGIPGRILDFFQSAAGGGADPYRQALEKLRAEYGNLSIGTSKAIQNMMPNLKNFEQSGLRLSRVFGFGREGAAKALAEFMKIATEIGPLGRRFMETTAGISDQVIALSKAGLGSEVFRSMQAAAENGGESVQSATRNMVKDVARAERAFNISSRELMKDMTEITKNFATFGIMSRQQMLTTSVYVKKLGISIETLKKTVDKSLNFEDAAEQAAKLAEGFNIALDPMKQLREQDPVKKLDNIRQAFFKTGRNIDQMSVAERRYFASLAGVSEEEARTVFAQKNRALTGEQLDRQMKKSQKTQISQAEAMKTLAQSIERLVLSGQALHGGFLQMFFKGFERGIRRTKEFREVVWNLQKSMRTVLYAGVQVGQMFVHIFPGVSEMLRGLASAFDPRRFRVLMSQVVEEFRRFFKLLQTDPKAGFRIFMKNMKDIFFNFFTKGAPAGARFLDGLKVYLKTIGVIMVEGLRYSLDQLRNVLHLIIDAIKNPEQLKNAATDIGSGFAGMFAQAFVYLKNELGPIIADIGKMLIELLKYMFENYVRPHLSKLFIAYFGPALFFGVARAAGAALIQSGFTVIMQKYFKAIPTVPTGGAGGVGGAAGGTSSGAAGAAGGAGGMTELKNLASTLGKVAGIMVTIALMAKLLAPLVISIARDFERSRVSEKAILGALGTIAVIGILFVVVGTFAKDIANVKIRDPESFIGILVAVGLVIAALAALGWLAVKLLGTFPMEQVVTSMAAMIAMGFLFKTIAGTIGEIVLLSSVLAGVLALTGGAGAAIAGPAAAIIIGIAAIIGLLAFEAYGIVYLFRSFNLEQVITAMVAVGVVGAMFAGIATLIAKVLIPASSGLNLGGLAGASIILIESMLMVAYLGSKAADFTAKFKEFKEEDVQKMITAVGGMALVFAVVTGAIALLYKIIQGDTPPSFIAKIPFLGTAAQAVGSFLNIGKLTVILGEIGTAISMMVEKARSFIQLTSTSDITEEKAKAVGTIMEALSKLFATVVAGIAALTLATRASVIGAIFGADIGSTLEDIQKILVGNDGNGGIMNTMKTMVDGILTSLQNMQGNPTELAAKADVFSKVATGIGALIDPMVKTLQAVQSLSDQFYYDVASKTNEILQKVSITITDLLKTLLEPNTGFIPKIIEQFKNISPNEAASLKAAGEFLGSLLPGLAEMTKVMPSMVEAATKLADLFYTGVAKDVGTILTSVTNTMTTFIGHLGGMIATIMTSVTPILSNSAISPEKLKAASSIGDIMKGVGEVLKALVPPPETVKAFNSVQDDMGYSSGIDSAALNRYVNDVMTNLTGIVGNETSGIMGMVKSIATMSITPDQIEKLKGIAPIITAIGDLINHITPSSQILDRITQQVAGNEHRGGVANLNKDIITAFMDKIKTELDGIIPTIKSFITEIADKLNSINPASIEGLKAIAPIVSSIGSLIGNLMPASAILDRITQTSRSGGLTTEQMQSNRTKIGEFFTTLTGYLNDLFLGSSNTSRGGGTRTGGIIGFIGKLTELLSSANLDETNVKGLTVIGGLVTSIANMIVPIMGALQTFGQSVTGRDAGTVYQQGQQMTAIIEAVTTAIETIFSTTLPALVSSIVHMELPRSGVHGLESRVKAIKGIFDIVGSLATIISGFKTENGTGGGFHGNMLNMWHEVFNPIISLLTYMFVVGDNGGIRGEGDKLKRVIDALSSDTFKNLSNLGRRTTNLKSLFEALGTVATTAKTLKDTFHGTANTINLGDLDAGFSSIQNALAPFQTGGRAEFLLQTGSGSLFENINKAHSNLVGTGRNAKGMGTKLEEIKKQLGTLKDSSADLITSMSGISSVSTSEMDRSLGNLKTNVNGILTSLDTFVTDMATSNHNEGRVGRILAAIGGRSFLGQVHQAVNAYGNFSKELATLTAQIGAQSFDVSLNRLGETLTGHADRTISNAAANVQVNINVRLEAGQVAEALYNYSTGPGSSPHGGAPRPYGFTRAAQANGTGTFG